jgi:alginate O-acetyltransferase complex protein AlgJ
MNNHRFRILAFGFAALLLLPALDQVFGFSERFQSTENKQQNKRPVLHFPHVRSFVKQFDPYYKENFGFRNALFYVYSRWQLRGLNQSPLPEKVVVGKNGWFFLGDSYNNVIKQHRGLMPLSADSARLIANHLAQRQAELARQGIKLYVLIAPDSHSIYPEFLPDRVAHTTGNTRLDVLQQAITAQTHVPFIDLRDTLLAAKKSEVVYYQTDTHWNDYGTLVGSAALLNRIRQDVPTLRPVRKSDFSITKMKGGTGDLVRMMALQDAIRDPVFYEIKPAAPVLARQVAEIPNTETGPNSSGFPSTQFSGPTGMSFPKLLFIGDSFSHSMMPFVAGYFRESYFARSRFLNPALVQQQKPDVVVVQIVERNLGWLGGI